MKKYITPLLLAVVCFSGFVGGILFEANRVNDNRIYTEETEARFKAILTYVNEYHSNHGVYPKDITKVNYDYIGSHINYEVLEDGFSLSSEIPEPTLYSKLLMLDDKYTLRMNNLLAISVYGD